ncbi:MAG TPA: MFS transporter [Gammaproteobacteria bacterium]|nr:MFS transporter [Gammaproteobacteria bacterium]
MPDRMTRDEVRTALALSAVFFMRMMGLFMVLPVLALYVEHLQAATPLLIGCALGIYGLTQASLQIPFGKWSDRVGRRPVITVGLVVFALGGLVAAASTHIYAVILGRALQGAGAVSGATLALAADLTRPSQRTKTMAIIGVSIGAAFTTAFLVGPLLDAWFGLRGVFLAGAALGLAALLLLWIAVPTPAAAAAPVEARAAEGRHTTRELRHLQTSVFFLHLVLAASFVAIPVLLASDLGLPKDRHFELYIPVLAASVLLIWPLLRSSREHMDRRLFAAAIACLGVGEALLWLLPARIYPMAFALTIFFTGFNYLEALLPSWISRAAPSAQKGSSLGAYATGQFLGTFVGGLAGGALAGYVGTHGVFAAAALVCAGWLVFSLRETGRRPADAAA